MLALPVVVAAALPAWVWATLLMTAFVGVSIGTILLMRYPLRGLLDERRSPLDRKTED